MAKSYQETLAEMMAASTPATMSLRRTVSEDTAVMALAEEAENWQKINDESKYKTFSEFVDENFSVVDEMKNVSMDSRQVNVTQESNSQFVPFKMPRYYDGIDHADNSRFTIMIYYVNAEGYGEYCPVVNAYYSDTHIKFGWMIPRNALVKNGTLSFEIHVTGTIVSDDNKITKDYLFKTVPNKELKVLEALSGNTTIEPDESWVNTLITQISEQTKIATDAADKAEAAATKAEKTASGVEQQIKEAATEAAEEIRKELETTHYTKEQLDPILEDKADDTDIVNLQGQIDLLKTSVDNFDGLASFKSTYDEHTGELAFYNGEELMEGSPHTLMTNPTDEWSNAYKETIQNELVKPVSDKLDQHMSDSDTRMTNIEGDIVKNTAAFDDYYKKEETLSKEEIEQKIADIDISSQFDALEQNIAQNYYNKTEADGKYAVKSVETDILAANQAITKINQELTSIDKSPNAQYITTYNEPYTYNDVYYTGENAFVLYEIFYKDTEQEVRNIVSVHIIQGGSGSGSANTITIDRITASPLVVTANDKVIIEYKFTGTDNSGDDIGQGTATWKVGNRVVKNETVYTGERSCDLTEFLSVASDQKVTLTITDEIGTMQTKTWYVSVVDVKLESKFDDTKRYPANSPVTFTFTPYGAVDKTVHILMDGKEIGTVASNKAAAGLSSSYSIPAQSHGTHLVEIYMTADINNNTVESNHIMKDIIWYDETSDVPVISTVQQEFKARQYEATNITFTVYDPSTETPEVNLRATYVNEDGEIVEEYNSTLVMTTNTDFWQFKSSVIGEHTLTITCGETIKTLKATITELGIEVTPITAGLAFDFNPVGYSNNDANRLWFDGDVAMNVSDNFDWVNGGYQIDENGDQYFCVKAGTTATVNYNLFDDDAKANGKEFKVIFKTANVKNRNTSFISCMDYGIGLDMKVESANIYSSNGSLYSPYCEDDVIEFEFNINKSTDIPMVMTYEDGVGNRPMIYTSDSSFWQTNPTPIVIGSANCDVHIYRMKAYSNSLSDRDILNNYIADARNAEEMIARHTKNQIYKDGVLNPEYLAEVCPDLRIILIDAPWFTNDKDNKIDDTNITMIYKNGDPVLDNWTCTGARHRGQGTSSNEYGYASRNIDLVMDTDTSLFTLGDGKTTSSTITLTRTSVPTDYLNVKVNVASSEHANNAQNARDYSLFNPFIRFARWKDSKVKDCMEFYNCVIFIRERNEDISTHREFQDTEYHFYSIGNVGDSKKTDDTRVNDKNDPLECVVEITDYNVPLAEFPTGVDGICSEEEWKAGNIAYDHLYTEYEYEDGEFKSFGNGSYEFRYEMKKITNEQRQTNIDNWREFYKFVVTSSDDEFYARLKEWFVVDSALYYRLFVENRTMVDNLAKNSFWHYGKVYISETEAEALGEDAGGYTIDNEQAAIRNGYRWDLSFGYDFDTSYGIGNTGKLNIPYGKEDTDFYVDGDSTSGYIYRAAESTFFCRTRDLFKSELQAMYVELENKGLWSSTRTIKQWDDSQSQFPEELWRLHFQRVYERTYRGISVDNSIAGEANPRFLEEMWNGKKKYQRRMFMRNQELYFASKYFGKVATQDQIMMRFNNPVGATIAPDFTLYITPFSDMYIGTSFGNVTPTNFRAKAGVEYTIPCSIESGTADITLIYAASFIQAIGDLSRCYVGDNDFSKASRLQSLIIGSNVEGYENTFMTKINVGNNKLLEYLDIRKVTGLNSVVDLSACGNLIELHAEDSGATGVIFANGGKVEKAYIPAVTSLTMKNLNYLEEFVVNGYGNLQTLVVENTPFINTYNVVNNSPNLKTLRLIGMDWDSSYGIENSAILDRLITMRGIDNSGGEISTSVLAGDVYITVMREQALYTYNNTWKDLVISYGSMINQFPVTFVNHDETILDVQYVDKGTLPVDPVTRENNPIASPTKEPTIDKVFTYIGWDKSFIAVHEPMTFTATYSSSVREYEVKYVSPFETNPLQINTAPYGSIVEYKGDIPTYTTMEGQTGGYKYHLFDRWDKSGYVNGDKTITAVFDSCTYTGESYFNGKEFNNLRPVEKYMLLKLNASSDIDITDGNIVSIKDELSFTMGEDYDFDEIESKLLVENEAFVDTGISAVFTGSNYVDTGISIMDEDRDFVIAVDFEFESGNTKDDTLMECFDYDQSEGFRLSYSGSEPSLYWTDNSTTASSGTDREMIVIRHIKGESGLHVYKSNIAGSSVEYVSLSNKNRDYYTSISKNLVFGCAIDLSGKPVSYASGTIHWAKVWYGDLGNETCKNIAKYTRETVTTWMCGYNRKILAEGGSYGALSFLSTHVLRHKERMIISGGTTGGWGVSVMKGWLNNRFYNGLPLWMRQLIKSVRVNYLNGGSDSGVSSCNCHIFIPSITSLSNIEPYTEAPYENEESAVRGNKCISYMLNPTDAIRKDHTGQAVEYWTRSVLQANSSYFVKIKTDGTPYAYSTSGTNLGIVIEFCM